MTAPKLLPLLVALLALTACQGRGPSPDDFRPLGEPQPTHRLR